MPIIDQTDADQYLSQGDCRGWRLCDAPDLAVTREAMPAGRAETRHRHREARQVFFCLTGTLDIETDSETVRLAAGQSFALPPGTWHVARAPGTAEVLVISAPSTRSDREEG